MPNIKLALPAAICALIFSASASAFSIDSMLGKSQAATTDTAREPATTYCIVDDEKQIEKCPDGQMLLYAPNTFGNKQMPLIIIAAYCDDTAPISFNEGGVVCRKVSIRQQFNPKQEALKSEWQDLRKNVLAKDSGYQQLETNQYIKYVKTGSDTRPELPYKATISLQELDVEGNPVGQSQYLEQTISKNNADKPFGKPAGTQFDIVLFNGEPDNWSRTLWTIEKTEPIVKKSEKPQKKAKR